MAEIAGAESILPLTSLLQGSDEDENHEAMFSLIHLIEDFGDKFIDKVIESVTKRIPSLYWSSVLNIRLINSDEYATILRDVLIKQKDDQNTYLKEVLLNIRDKYPITLDKVNDIMSLS